MADFGYCFDCKELNYAITNRNGVFEFNKMSSNHFGHNCMTFLEPNRYCSPIQSVLTKLNMNAPITHNEIVLFKLAIDLGELDRYDNRSIQEEEVKSETDQLSLF